MRHYVYDVFLHLASFVRLVNVCFSTYRLGLRDRRARCSDLLNHLNPTKRQTSFTALSPSLSQTAMPFPWLFHFATLRWRLLIIIVIIIIIIHIIISYAIMITETKQVVWRPLFVERKTSHVDLAATAKLRGWILSNSALAVHHNQISLIHRVNVVIDTAIQSQQNPTCTSTCRTSRKRTAGHRRLHNWGGHSRIAGRLGTEVPQQGPGAEHW